MKYQNLVFVLASAAVLIMSAIAQNPADIIGAPIKEKINQAQAQIPQEITQHIVEGNVAPEHLQKDFNATTQELKKTAAQEIQQHVNNTSRSS